MPTGKLLQRARLQRTQVQQAAPGTSPRLARSLHAVLIDCAVVHYHRAEEDPQATFSREIAL